MAQAIGLVTLNAANFESGNAGDGQVLTADGSGGAAWENAAGGGATYKVYTALLTQTGTDAPVASVLENTLGGTPVWTREGDGFYLLTLTGAFPVGTITLPRSAVHGSVGLDVLVNFERIDNDTISLRTYDVLEPGYMDFRIPNNFAVEIRVYPIA